MWQRTETQVAMTEGRDHCLNELLRRERPYLPCAVMDSEDTLFLLYTSGSTGKPKAWCTRQRATWWHVLRCR